MGHLPWYRYDKADREAKQRPGPKVPLAGKVVRLVGDLLEHGVHRVWRETRSVGVFSARRQPPVLLTPCRTTPPSAERPDQSRPRNGAARQAVNQPEGMNDKGVGTSTDVAGMHVPQVVPSASAAAALLKLRRERGPQVIELGMRCAAVSIARVHDRHNFNPHQHHVKLGVVANCTVYADIRHIEFCPHEMLVIDLHAAPHGGSPVFITRPESRSERQQRMFADSARAGGLH